MNSVEPVEKPQTHCAGDVENYLPEFNLPVLSLRLFFVNAFDWFHDDTSRVRKKNGIYQEIRTRVEIECTPNCRRSGVEAAETGESVARG